MKFVFSAGIVVYFKRKEKVQYLLLLNANGHWDFTKGKIEKGEDKMAAAIRETYEEAGIAVQIDESFEHTIEYFFKEKDGELIRKKVYFFAGKAKTKQIKISFEHIDYGWFSFKEAQEKLSYKNAKQVLQAVHDFLEA